MTPSSPSITRGQAWWLAIRPRTLPAAISPVLVGAGLAVGDDRFRLLPVLAALAGALLLQIASNLANDYYDFIKGYDRPERKGPTRVALSGLISLRDLRLGLLLVMAAAALIGLYLVLRGGWPILLLGVAALVCAVLYSGGPFPLAANGLGDLFVFIFFGLAAVVGTYYVQALVVAPHVWLAALPPGFLITAILVVNNLRDIETDAAVGKRTLAVRLGARATRWQYSLLLVGAYLVPLALLVSGAAQAERIWPSLLLLLPWLTLPRAWALRRVIYAGGDGMIMNRALAGTAQLGLLFSLLFAVALAFQ
ncbi:MAG: 1,4-dihydroxy-2-naphthoate polyprenyltransferase [Caldilineales bacterium]